MAQDPSVKYKEASTSDNYPINISQSLSLALPGRLGWDLFWGGKTASPGGEGCSPGELRTQGGSRMAEGGKGGRRKWWSHAWDFWWCCSWGQVTL